MEKDKVNATARQIRKELAILIQSKIKEGIPENKAVTLARQETNKKYGKDWRMRGTLDEPFEDSPSHYYEK